MDERPICTILTPPARGAVATVAVRGPGADVAVGRRFRPASGRPLESIAVGRVIFGRFRLASGADEELVVGLLGQDNVEVHCHGGSSAVAAVAGALVEAGCRLSDGREWAAREHADPLVAAAYNALSDARTEMTAAILLDQGRGALRSAISGVQRALRAGDEAAARTQFAELLDRGRFGAHLTQPWRVALAGRPNVGKSTLMNAIVGYQRSIVFEQPGTTRDVLTANTAINGWPVELADTAGLRAAGDEIEAAGVQRALAEIAAADAVLLIADATAAWDEELLAQVAAQQPARLLIAHNKHDLRPPPDDRPAGVAVSAKTGDRIEALCQEIITLLVPCPLAPGDAVPFTGEQLRSLGEASACLERGDMTAALASLDALATAPQL